MHIVFMVSKYIIYVLSDFRDQIPLRLSLIYAVFFQDLNVAKKMEVVTTIGLIIITFAAAGFWIHYV